MSKLDDFHHELLKQRSAPWALAPSHAPMLAQTLAELSAGRRPTAYSSAPTRHIAAVETVPAQGGKRVAVLSARGVVMPDYDLQPWCFGARRLAQNLEELTADPAVSAIVVMMDSPGGTCTWTPEAADALHWAAQMKTVHVAVESLCASAALWIASGASSISCLPSGDGVGSIGVRAMHIDVSKQLEALGVKVTFIHSGEHKIEGNMFQPLSAETKARYQKESDAIYSKFVGAVARGRQVTTAVVQENFGKGRVLMPTEARRSGLIDSLELPQDTLRRAMKSNPRKGASGSAELERERLRLALLG